MVAFVTVVTTEHIELDVQFFKGIIKLGIPRDLAYIAYKEVRREPVVREPNVQKQYTCFGC